MHVPKQILSTAFLALALAGACGRAAAAADFALADYASVARLSEPTVSPDGKQAALIVSRADLAQNQVHAELVMVDLKTGTQRVLASGDEISHPAFAPDGAQIAWLAADPDKVQQIHMLSLQAEGASPVVVARTSAVGEQKAASIRAFAWSPDGAMFGYLAPASAPLPAGDARFDRTFELPDSDYLGTSYLARSRGAPAARLWVIPAQGGAARQLTAAAAEYIDDLAWQLDGKTVFVSARPSASEVSARFGWVSAVDAATGSQRLVIASPAQVGNETGMKVSVRGVLGLQRFHGADPWLYDHTVALVIDGKVREVSSSLDRDITHFDWLPNGDLLVQCADHLRTLLWALPLHGEPHKLDLGMVNVSASSGAFAVGRSSGVVAFIGSEPALPPELYVMSSTKAKPIRVTKFNEALLQKHLGRMQAVTWRNDGFDQEGVLTLPPDFTPGHRYPLLVLIHGGPHSSSQLSFGAAAQFYAANGWLAFEPNYRGSSGQGDRYRTAVIGDATAGPGRDIRAGMAAVEALDIVDDTRVAVTGYSYGGVMTSWMIGHYHDWCAAIPGGSVVDFVDYYDQSETGLWIGSLLGSPHLAQNRQKYLDQSPAGALDQAVTPTLILQNVGDPNATIGQAYRMYHTLKDHGIKTRFVASDLDGHGHGDPFHETQAYALTFAWMTENCAGKTP